MYIKHSICRSLSFLLCVIKTLNPLAILAKNLPESTQNPTPCTKIQHHAQTLPPNCWTWMEVGHPTPCNVSLLVYTVLSPSKSNKPFCWSLNGLRVVEIPQSFMQSHYHSIVGLKSVTYFILAIH